MTPNEGDSARRRAERRVKASAWYLPERRSGFDRRRNYPVLGVLRSSAWALAAILIAINLMSVADWLFTMQALRLGAVEGNPILAGLLDGSPAMAATFKFAVTGGVTLTIWLLRRYRLILATSVVGVTAYTALIAYHLGNLAVIASI